ncbi:LysR family transcriptional regulator [Thiobacillus sp.]|uniref:LysR family transcriptional regulator n=1 Tax=Thiobacillus sp. TaxID=924 RepID=UPI00286DE17F|nr:LysR family transcriptional regulator [Thiobacillus sp.]
MNPSHIELRHLRLLQAVSEAGGLTAAAERLHLTQSAVSHQLKALEDALGLALVERAARPLGLTAAGRRLLALAHSALPQVDAALRDLAKLRDGDAGELRIAVECHTCYDWLMPAMDRYRDVWPGVELDLLGGFQADPIGLLLDKRADLVITSDTAPRPGIVYAPLFGFEMLALLPPDHPLASRKWLLPADFAGHTLITYPVPEDRLDLIRRVLAPAGIKPPRREAQLTVAILQLVASRRGLAALPAWAVAPYIERGYVAARPVGRHGLWAELHIAVRAADAARAYVADFIDTVRRDSFARLPGIRPLVSGTAVTNAPA